MPPATILAGNEIAALTKTIRYIVRILTGALYQPVWPICRLSDFFTSIKLYIYIHILFLTAHFDWLSPRIVPYTTWMKTNKSWFWTLPTKINKKLGIHLMTSQGVCDVALAASLCFQTAERHLVFLHHRKESHDPNPMAAFVSRYCMQPIGTGRTVLHSFQFGSYACATSSTPDLTRWILTGTKGPVSARKFGLESVRLAVWNWYTDWWTQI